MTDRKARANDGQKSTGKGGRAAFQVPRMRRVCTCFSCCHSRRESASSFVFVLAVALAFLSVIPAGNLLLPGAPHLAFEMWDLIRAKREPQSPAQFRSPLRLLHPTQTAPILDPSSQRTEAISWTNPKSSPSSPARAAVSPASAAPA